jgi:hypothetical protein
MLGTVGVVQGKDALQDCNAQQQQTGQRQQGGVSAEGQDSKLGCDNAVVIPHSFKFFSAHVRAVSRPT